MSVNLQPRLILYVKFASRACQGVINVARQIPGVTILDIDSLRMRPPWLSGIPAIWVVETRQNFHGANEVLSVLRKYAEHIQKISTQQSGFATMRRPSNYSRNDPSRPAGRLPGRIPSRMPPGMRRAAETGEPLLENLQPQMSIGEKCGVVPPTQTDDPRYHNNGSITQADIEAIQKARTKEYKYSGTAQLDEPIIDSGKTMTLEEYKRSRKDIQFKNTNKTLDHEREYSTPGLTQEQIDYYMQQRKTEYEYDPTQPSSNPWAAHVPDPKSSMYRYS